ncbi:MAG: ATP-binding protein [Cytophagaceae bacterium]
MEKLLITTKQKAHSVPTSFIRPVLNKINWNNRLIIMTGARGVGKTTLLLQYINIKLPYLEDKVLFITLDDIYFSKNNLLELAEQFVQFGGEYLIVDEVHKYPGWSREIKNIYDTFPELKIVVTGSSTLEIYKGEGDLSRRARIYHLQGLSLREYLEYEYKLLISSITLEEILNSKNTISLDLSSTFKPMKVYNEYLKEGYYPFYKEDKEGYGTRLLQTLNVIFENDLSAVYNIDYTASTKLKKLLSIIASLVPFKPNISKLSQQLDVSRETLMRYLYFLQKADVIRVLNAKTGGISLLNKPEKVYLNNTNLSYALSEFQQCPNTGNLRETFFLNQISYKHLVQYSEKGDFVVDQTMTFEVGGKNKTSKQIMNVENSWIVADNLEVGSGNKIPLWLFGLLY